MAEIGQILDGRYRLIELLGQGGMATIYRAADTGLGRDVALKLLRPEYLRDPDFSSRFRQEAQAAASLTHPNVVTVYDYGEDPSGPFIVMELVDGEDLATILRRSGALPPRQAARIGAGVGRALAAAHGSGIVHRDVKPGNVLIGRDGRVKVVDFGIARAVAEAQVTLPGTTLGSVHYFSPEQARGDAATAASDIYSLGIVLYEMLTGVRPWEGDSAASVALARLTGPIPDPSAVRTGLPPDVVAITRKALAREPADRFASASAMADELERWLATAAQVAAAAPPPRRATPQGPTDAAAAAAVAAAAVGLSGASAAPPSGVISGTARANPARLPYPPEAYVGADADDGDEFERRGTASGRRPPPPRPRGYRDPGADNVPSGPSALVWLTGIAAIGLLAAIAFVVFQLVGGGGAGASAAPQVSVPSFVGQPITTALQTADALGITLSQTPETSDQAAGTVLSQDLAVGTLIPANGTVRVTVAAAAAGVPVPDLKNLPESDALGAIIDAGLRPGLRTEAPDPIVPAGQVSGQSPLAGIVVARTTRIDYVVSTGPAASPSDSPSPSPSPSPTPTPTPEPTPSPTPQPTPSPTPQPTPTPTPQPTPSPTPQPTPTPTPEPSLVIGPTAEPSL